MKANPGGTVTGEAIIGRASEIAQLWGKLQKRSVELSAERRVGKTSILRKMADHPQNNWIPILVFVESARHPIDCVETLYTKASESSVHSTKGEWMRRLRKTYEVLGTAAAAGWKLPQIQADWRRAMRLLVEDIVDNCPKGAILMIDEFPLMIWNIAADHGPQLAMQFLDALREIRQQFEASGRIRFVLSGSIGFHLVLQHLKLDHGYRGAPTNDMHRFVLTGMDPADTDLMCQRYLDDEGIERVTKEAVTARMYERTGGLPLYIAYVCEAIQESGARQILPEDIDRILDGMLSGRQVHWFNDAADRIDGYYSKLGFAPIARTILNRLSREEHQLKEATIINAVHSQDPAVTKAVVMRVLELLTDDNYL